MKYLLIGSTEVRVTEQAPASIPPGMFLWCDCPHEQARQWVADVQRLTGVPVFDDHLDDAENLGHPSFFDSTTRYEVIVFRGLAIQDRAEAARMAQVRTRPTTFFVFPRCLVSVRAADSRIEAQMRERLMSARESNQRLPAGPEDLMLRMLNGLIDSYLDLRQPLTEQIEHWQRLLLDARKAFRDWPSLLKARQEARKLEHLCEEQLDALQEWRDERIERMESPQGPPAAAGGDADPAASPRDVLPAFSDLQLVRIADLVNHIQRVISHARRLESSVESAVQLHFSATAHRTNEIMRTLTTLTAVFMPLNLITGIFGMNFDFIPGLHSPMGFWLSLGVMGLIAAALVAFFRARRYLSRSDGAFSRPPAT